MKFQMHPINLPAKWLTQSMSLLIMWRSSWVTRPF
jgi:hypothetical protein